MEKRIEDFRRIIVEADTKKEKLVLEQLPYNKDELDPILSKESLDQHYGILAKKYVERFNAGEGDPDFNKAGAFLHNIFFPQLQKPAGTNKLIGVSLEFINKHYNGSFNLFN